MDDLFQKPLISKPKLSQIALALGAVSLLAFTPTGKAEAAQPQGVSVWYCTGPQECTQVSPANPLPTYNAAGSGFPATVNQGASGVSAWTIQGSVISHQPAPVAPTVSASGIASLVLNAGPTSVSGGVMYFHAENATAVSGYCVLYNATSAPATGALTAAAILAFQLLPPNGYCDWSESHVPIAASSGAVVLLSSAANPYTYTSGITGSIYGLAQ